MKKIVLILCAVLFLSAATFAAGPAQYQVTGPVLEVRDDAIERDADTRKCRIICPIELGLISYATC